MIRLTALWLVVSFLVVFAWRDWFKAACGLVCLMAVIEHPDMPKTLFGIQGLNPWNIALLSVVLAWLTSRPRERLHWDLPKWLTVLTVLYGGVVTVSFVRLVLDVLNRDIDVSILSLTSEYLVNALKWVVPGIMIYDGCRDEARLKIATWSILAVYVLLAVQVIRWMYPFAGAGGDELQRMSLRILPKEVGFHRVNLSAMFAGAAWALVAARALLPKGLFWTTAAYGASVLVLVAQALTGGRTGYATWALLGFALASLRWRKQILLAPVIALAIAMLVPGAVERMEQGFTKESRDTNVLLEEGSQQITAGGTEVDLYTVTSGRTLIWPFVWARIVQRPWVGYGRLAMQRTGITTELAEKYGESEAFPHPHNAYLEWLLDTGWLGMAVIAPIYAYIIWMSASLFRDRRLDAYGAIGGAALAIVGAILIAGTGSQTFYPREGAVTMWAAVGLAMRIAVERKRVDEELGVSSAQPAATRRRGWTAPPAAAALEGNFAVARRGLR